ncbi:GNAT family N-acetyltransferase [Jeotgalibacillus sp. ET6]|uniref:GNAT family N-acetyltransferase n=1 Tax=Jeotgalibacillus sp. ET6 TaxID=3037260 RepID=UPI002418A3DE|nr:GNAT family N-acetyltransferase [Jeotgalibacillus sp. ET6]MDG5473719.1 GNAT family N-acetyltransferase [Jeotgalibacillus sp. ET6]
MAVTLIEVLESEKFLLRNLYSLYLHDLSKFTSTIDIGADGSFEYESLDKFWKVDGLSPYFIKIDDNIIGFILLLERPFLKKENDYGVNDIFLLNKYKGKGIGRQAIEKLFQEKRGRYFVIELIENKSAVCFWKKLYTELNIQCEERCDLIDDEPCLIQIFKI